MAMLLLASSPAPAEDTVVTALSGNAWLNGAALAMHQKIPAGSQTIDIESDEEGSCALLSGSTALIQLCGKTKLKIHPTPAGDDQPDVIEILHGELRVSALRTRKTVKRRLEIRTPTAIARPFATTVHLFVEPTFGSTIVSSLEGRTLVISSDPTKKRSALLNTGQRVEVREGEVPGVIQKFSQDVSVKLEGCFSDAPARVAALQSDSMAASQIALEQIAEADVPDASTGFAGAPFPTQSENRPGPTDSDYFDPDCNPTNCGLQVLFPNDPLAPPPPCIGLPGEQCQGPG